MSDNHTKIKRLLAEHLGAKEEELTLEARLIEDLGADSLDIVEIVMALEEEFEFDISDEDAEKFTTVQDLVNHADRHTATASRKTKPWFDKCVGLDDQ